MAATVSSCATRLDLDLATKTRDDHYVLEVVLHDFVPVLARSAASVGVSHAPTIARRMPPVKYTNESLHDPVRISSFQKLVSVFHAGGTSHDSSGSRVAALEAKATNLVAYMHWAASLAFTPKNFLAAKVLDQRIHMAVDTMFQPNS